MGHPTQSIYLLLYKKRLQLLSQAKKSNEDTYLIVFLQLLHTICFKMWLPPVLFWYLMKQEKTSESYQSIKDKLCNNLERKGGRRSFHEYTVNLYANHDWLMFSCVGHNLVRCRTWTNAKDSLYFLKPQWGFSSSYTCLLTHCVKSPIFGPKIEFWRNLVQII